MDDTLRRFFGAMQRGPEAEDELVALFTEDAVYVEPFDATEHVGRQAIAEWLRGSWAQRPPGMRLTVERVDVVDHVVEAGWVCESEAFARPARGRDRFTIRDGRVARLESELLEPPEPVS
jgi:ketosteroid isomerase-like protein